MLKNMLEINADKRPQIEDIQNVWNTIIDKDVYSLFLQCLSAFSTTSFHLPDLRISLIYSIFKFIES